MVVKQKLLSQLKRVAKKEDSPKCMYYTNDYTDEDRKVLCKGCREYCKYNKTIFNTAWEEGFAAGRDDMEEQMRQEYVVLTPIGYQEALERQFKEGMKKQKELISENNMLLPFKEYDNLMNSINKVKKLGYENGFKQAQKDFVVPAKKVDEGVYVPSGWILTSDYLYHKDKYIKLKDLEKLMV